MPKAKVEPLLPNNVKLLFPTSQETDTNVEFQALLATLFPKNKWASCATEFVHELMCINDILSGVNSQSYLMKFVAALEKRLPTYKLIPYLQETTIMKGEVHVDSLFDNKISISFFIQYQMS